MTLLFSNDAAYEYMQVNRHWHSASERYAGGDALATAINRGWRVGTTVYHEQHFHAGARAVSVYHFALELDGVEMTMPVLSNPYVRRVMRRLKADVVPFEQRVSARERQTSRRS